MNASEAAEIYKIARIERETREARQAAAERENRYSAVRRLPQYVADEVRAEDLALTLGGLVRQRANAGNTNLDGVEDRTASISIERSAPGYTPRGITDGIQDSDRKLLRDPAFIADIVATLDRAKEIFEVSYKGYDLEINHYFQHGYCGDHTVVFRLHASF